jgi:hypothetical protein
LESDSDIELEGNDENEKLHVQLKEEKHIVIIESDKERTIIAIMKKKQTRFLLH